MNLQERFRDTLQRGLRRAVIAGAAEAIGLWIERVRCSPEDLEEAICEDRPLLQVALREVPAEAWVGTQAAIGNVVGSFGKQEYLEILKVLSQRYPDHAQVLWRHRDWYAAQMDEVKRRLAT